MHKFTESTKQTILSKTSKWSFFSQLRQGSHLSCAAMRCSAASFNDLIYWPASLYVPLQSEEHSLFCNIHAQSKLVSNNPFCSGSNLPITSVHWWIAQKNCGKESQIVGVVGNSLQYTGVHKIHLLLHHLCEFTRHRVWRSPGNGHQKFVKLIHGIQQVRKRPFPRNAMRGLARSFLYFKHTVTSTVKWDTCLRWMPIQFLEFVLPTPVPWVGIWKCQLIMWTVLSWAAPGAVHAQGKYTYAITGHMYCMMKMKSSKHLEQLGAFSCF